MLSWDELNGSTLPSVMALLVEGRVRIEDVEKKTNARDGPKVEVFLRLDGSYLRKMGDAARAKRGEVMGHPPSPWGKRDPGKSFLLAIPYLNYLTLSFR